MAEKDAILIEIDANVKRYEAKLRALPGFTEKQAKATADRWGKQQQRAFAMTEAGLKKTSDAGAKAGEDIAKGFARSKEQVSLLAEGLGRVSPELGAIAANAGSALGILQAMAGPLAVIGAGATAAAGGFLYLNKVINESQQRMLEASNEAIKAQLGIVDNSRYRNQAIEANEKASLLRRKKEWWQAAADYAQVFSAGGFNPIANAIINQNEKIGAQIEVLDGARERNIELAQAQIDRNASLEKETEERTKHLGLVNKLKAAEIEWKDSTAEMDAEQFEKEQRNQEVTREQLYAEAEERKRLSREEFEQKQRLSREEFEQKQADAAEQAARDLQYAKNYEQAQIDAANAVFNLGQTFAGLEADQSRAAFEAQKAFALAQIAMNTAVAITRALAVEGPLGQLRAGVILAAGTAQAATVAAQQAPTFHTGGIIGPDNARTSSQDRTIRAQIGEAVISRSQTARMGRDGVRDMNRGMSSGSNVMALVYEHQTMDKVLVDNLERRGPFYRRINKNSRVGHG